MKKVRINFFQMLIIIGISILSIKVVALASTIIDSNGITGTNSGVSFVNRINSAGTYSFNVDGNSLFNGTGYFRDNVLLNNSLLDQEAVLKIDGTYATSTSAALLQIVGTTSRMMFVSGESSFPTTWALGINTALSVNPDQNFQIREVNNGSSIVDLPRLTITKDYGYMGVGTSTPTGIINTYEDNDTSWVIGSGEDGYTSAIRWKFGNRQAAELEIDDTVKQFEIAAITGWTLQFRTNSTISANVDLDGNWDFLSNNLTTSGRVGIGTTTPATNLQVYGGDSATSTIQIGGPNSNKGGCIKVQDSDGAGYTYLSFLRGAMTATTTPCN